MTKHCRKSSHSRTNENLRVIQIQKALWSKLQNLKPFFSCNKELYVSTEQATGEEVDMLPSPTLTKASFVSTNDHLSINKNSKVELKIYDVEFEI